MLQQVEFARWKGVDQLVRQGGNLGPKGCDAARGEGAQHKAAQAGVARRLQFQHGMGLDGVERRKVGGEGQRRGAFAAKAAVAEDGVAGGGIGGAGQAVVGPVKERAKGAGPFIERIGILHKGGVGGRLLKGFQDVASLRSGMTPCATSTPTPTTAAPSACAHIHGAPRANITIIT